MGKNVCPYCKTELDSTSRVVDGKTEVTLCQNRFDFNLGIIRALSRFVGRRIDIKIKNLYNVKLIKIATK